MTSSPGSLTIAMRDAHPPLEHDVQLFCSAQKVQEDAWVTRQ
jgi:hypothetical protein